MKNRAFRYGICLRLNDDKSILRTYGTLVHFDDLFATNMLSLRDIQVHRAIKAINSDPYAKIHPQNPPKTPPKLACRQGGKSSHQILPLCRKRDFRCGYLNYGWLTGLRICIPIAPTFVFFWRKTFWHHRDRNDTRSSFRYLNINYLAGNLTKNQE